MAEWTIGEIVLYGFAATGCVLVVILFFMGLNIPPECCAPSPQPRRDYDIESELIQ